MLVHKGGLFGRPAEADESYWGRKERNKHASKKAKAGRGPAGKMAEPFARMIGKRLRYEDLIA